MTTYEIYRYCTENRVTWEEAVLRLSESKEELKDDKANKTTKENKTAYKTK